VPLTAPAVEAKASFEEKIRKGLYAFEDVPMLLWEHERRTARISGTTGPVLPICRLREVRHLACESKDDGRIVFTVL